MALYDSIIARIPGGYGNWLRNRRHKKLNRKKPETTVEHLVEWVRTIVWALFVVTILNGVALASFVVPTGSMEDTVLPGEFLFVNKLSLGPSTPQILPFINQPLPFYKLPAIFPPKQGDVIVFIWPGDRDQVEADTFQYYLKRCIAVAGDVLEIKNKRTYVNGVEFGLPEHGKFLQLSDEIREQTHIGEEFRTFPSGSGYNRDNYGPIRIPKEGDVIALNEQNIQQWATFIRREGHSVNEAALTIDGVPAKAYTVERDYVFGMGDNRDNSLDSRFWGFIPEHDVVGTPMVVYWSWDVNADGILAKLAAIRWSRIGTIIR